VEAGRGPSRADLAHWRYETYEIGPLLHAGRNVLAATVWQFGTQAAIAQMSERAGFLLHGAGEAERVAGQGAGLGGGRKNRNFTVEAEGEWIFCGGAGRTLEWRAVRLVRDGSHAERRSAEFVEESGDARAWGAARGAGCAE